MSHYINPYKLLGLNIENTSLDELKKNIISWRYYVIQIKEEIIMIW